MKNVNLQCVLENLTSGKSGTVMQSEYEFRDSAMAYVGNRRE